MVRCDVVVESLDNLCVDGKMSFYFLNAVMELSLSTLFSERNYKGLSR